MQNEITELLIKKMKQKGITQSDLADHMGCTQTTISNLLNGKSRMSVDDLNSISKHIGIQISDLFTELSGIHTDPITIPNDLQELLTSNPIAFYLINRLKFPAKEESLIEEVLKYTNQKNVFIKILNKLKDEQVIEKNSEGYLTLNISKKSILHFHITNQYSERLIEIYKAVRESTVQVSKNKNQLEKWKESNVDSFYLEYFTSEQIQQQSEHIRNFLDLVKHQIRSNSLSTKNNEEFKLRVIFASLSNYPISEVLKNE